MATLLSMLLTLGFAFWFYRTSEKIGSKSFQWAIAGAIAYQIPAWVWMLLVSKPYLLGLRSTSAQMSLSASLIGHSWILIGAIAALAVYKFLLLKTDVKAG